MQALIGDIEMTHERFVVAMSNRMPQIEADSLERYFAVLSKLVSKLEDDAKAFPEILNEMFAETAGIIMLEMQKRRG